MIEAALRAGPVTAPRRTDARLAGGPATHLGAVRVAAIAGRADGKQAVAPPAGLLTEGGIHGVGARGSDWTTAQKRGTTGVTGTDVGARVGHGGPVVKTGPPPLPVSSAYFTYTPNRPWTLPDLWTRRRAHKVVGTPLRGVPQRPPASPSSRDQKDPDRTVRPKRVQNHALSPARPQRWRTRAVRAQPEQPVLSRYGQVTGRHRVAFQTGVGRIGSRSRNHRLDSNLQMSHRGVVCRESGVPLSSACAWQTAGARRRIRPLAVGHVAS